MAQSLSKVILHIIFSTKNREPWLDANVRPRMHAYLATICRDNGAEFVRVGGVADHVHIATTLPRTISQAQLIEQMKKTSSSACPVSRVCVAARIWRIFGEPESARGCVRYIDGQLEHHRTPTFQEEYRELCESTASISTSIMSGIEPSVTMD